MKNNRARWSSDVRTGAGENAEGALIVVYLVCFEVLLKARLTLVSVRAMDTLQIWGLNNRRVGMFGGLVNTEGCLGTERSTAFDSVHK